MKNLISNCFVFGCVLFTIEPLLLIFTVYNAVDCMMFTHGMLNVYDASDGLCCSSFSKAENLVICEHR